MLIPPFWTLHSLSWSVCHVSYSRCILYPVSWTLNTVPCTLYFVSCTLCVICHVPMPCILLPVLGYFFRVSCIPCILYSVSSILLHVHSALHPWIICMVSCTLYLVFWTLVFSLLLPLSLLPCILFPVLCTRNPIFTSVYLYSVPLYPISCSPVAFLYLYPVSCTRCPIPWKIGTKHVW